MEIVCAGSLESISRPSSTTSEKGRKSQLKRLQPSSSLEVLPPEDVSGIPAELFSAVERDVDIEDFEEDTQSDSDQNDDLSSDGEMNQDNHDDTQEGCQSRTSQATGSQDDIPALEDSDVDPQIREGMERIKKLDKILADKLKKEKEVKNHRIQMEKMWKEQLRQQMVKTQEEDGSNSNKNLIGAALLALELGNEESLGSSRDDPSTPIFATQPLGTEERYYQASSTTTGTTSRASSSTLHSSKGSKKNRSKKHDKRRKGSQTTEPDKHTNSSNKQAKSKEMGQDFIERNKKLAADAANVIPMTEEEKNRLERLLSSDVNEMMENPFSDDANLRLTQGVGFTPDVESARALEEIDRKLEALVPSNELEMLSSRALTETPLSQRSEVSKTESNASSKHTKDNLDAVDIGEKVLRDEKEARTVHQRIVDIEKQLESLRKLSEDDTVDTISQDLLSKLINEDSRTTSSSSTIAETVVSSLTTPDYLAIEPPTPSTLRTESALSDVTLTSDVTLASDVTLTSDIAVLDVETPRTLTDSLNT